MEGLTLSGTFFGVPPLSVGGFTVSGFLSS